MGIVIRAMWKSSKKPYKPQAAIESGKPGSQPLQWGPAIIVVIVALSVYANTLYNGFVYDDAIQVLKNQWIRDIKYLPDIFAKSVWSFQSDSLASNYFRPLMHLIYMFTYHVFGLAPWGFHLVNMLFHAGVSVLVYFITSKLIRESATDPSSPAIAKGGMRGLLSPSLIAALLFATHPIHTEAVTWVAGVPELSFTFFYLLSFYLYMRAEEGLQHGYLFSVLLFSLALFCKETALTLPILLFGYDCSLHRRKGRKSDFWAFGKRYVPYACVTVVYLLFRFHALGGLAPEKRQIYLSTYQDIINVFPLLMQYICKLLIPINLNAFYVFYPILSIFELRAMLSLIITAIFMGLLLITWRRNRVVFFGLLLFIVPLIPVFYIPALGENTFAERYLYLPSAGSAVLIASLLTWARTKSLRMATCLTAALALVIGFCVVDTIGRNAIWRDDVTLYTDTVRKSPDAYLIHNNLGITYKEAGLLDSAIEQYLIALKLNPRYPEAHNNLGGAYKDKGLVDRAIEEYLIALRLNPSYPDAHYSLGNIYLNKGFADMAIRQYEAGLRSGPDYPEVHANLAVAYYEKGMVNQAVEHFQIAVKLAPGNADMHFNLGRIYLAIGDKERARKEFEAVLEVKPADSQTRQILNTLGR